MTITEIELAIETTTKLQRRLIEATTYDRTGVDVECGRCDGLGVDLNVKRFVDGLRAALASYKGGK